MTVVAPKLTPSARPRPTIGPLLSAVDDIRDLRPCEIVHRDQHSNDVTEIRFEDGRTLMLKRARHYPETAARRFAVARWAARLLRERAGVAAPEHLEPPHAPGEPPVEVYWRIPLRTLQEAWPEIAACRRAAALRSWGELIRRIHGVRLRAAESEEEGTPAFVRGDLEERLLPNLRTGWPDAVRAAERLLRAVPQVEARSAGTTAVLVHGDMHMGNVLCEGDGETVRCVGTIDLEAAHAGPPEADWATMQLLHGPLFGQPLEEGWLAHVAEGYGRTLDPVLLAFFRAYRLLNLGFHAAVTGLTAHAEEVASSAAREVELLGRLSRRRVYAAAEA
jgi:hypothetical protein